MHALFLALLGIFLTKASENSIFRSLHQQTWLESPVDTFLQLLLLLHKGQRLGLILSKSCFLSSAGKGSLLIVMLQLKIDE